MLRFAFGAKYAARRLSKHLAARQRHTVPRAAATVFDLEDAVAISGPSIKQ
jgi:hypothetical protein